MPKRMRRRYLALEIVSNQSIKERDVTEAVWDAVLRLFGEYGASQTNLRLIEYDPQHTLAVIRCSHTSLEKVRASIASITEINERATIIHIVGVAGTLRALRKKVFA